MNISKDEAFIFKHGLESDILHKNLLFHLHKCADKVVNLHAKLVWPNLLNVEMYNTLFLVGGKVLKELHFA